MLPSVVLHCFAKDSGGCFGNTGANAALTPAMYERHNCLEGRRTKHKIKRRRTP